MYYLNEKGERVYTLKVSERDLDIRAFYLSVILLELTYL